MKPDVELQYGRRLGEFSGMSSQHHLPHCMVLPPGEFNVMIPELRVTLQGDAKNCHCSAQGQNQGVASKTTLLDFSTQDLHTCFV